MANRAKKSNPSGDAEVGPAKIELPPPCDIGEHWPAIVSRCGGRDARYYNACGKCGWQIERCDGYPWMTTQQADQLAAADQTDAALAQPTANEGSATTVHDKERS